MAITDKFSKVGEPGSATYLANPGYSMGGSSINIQTYVGWPTGKIIFDMYTTRLVGNEEKAADNTRTSWQGIHNGSGTITSLQKLSGNDQNYTAGTTTRVIITHSAHWANQLIDGITAHANQDGSLKTAAVQTALGLGTGALNGWNPLPGITLSYASNDGNKQYTLNASADPTSILTPGMKLQVTRGTAPPTQCMSFTAASSQYATKASPAGITFTTAFTCEAWVYLNSYTGLIQAVVTRRDSSATGGGWDLRLLPSGQVSLIYGSGPSFTSFDSLQSVPLKRWVHIAGACTSTSSKTGQVYINGVAVSQISQSTAATSLSQQAVDLRVGAYASAPLNCFDGYILEPRVWSTARTAQQIGDNMNTLTVGNESGLVFALTPGTFNDKTSNGNNLTATNGASATQAMSALSSAPMNAVEYMKLTKVTNTQVTVFTGTDFNIPNMTLNTPLYSNVANPYGFPTDSSKWSITYINKQNCTVLGPVQATFYNQGPINPQLPIGTWKTSWKAEIEALQTSGNTTGDCSYTVSTSPTAVSHEDLVAFNYHNSNVSNIQQIVPVFRQTLITVTAPTTLYALLWTRDATSPTRRLSFRGDIYPTVIYAELAY